MFARCQPAIGAAILKLDKLQDDIHSVAKGDDKSRRQAFTSLKAIEEKEWASAPAKVVKSAVSALGAQLVNGAQQTFVRQEAVAILGNLGPRAADAVPYLADLLAEGVADGVREAAVVALGKIGKDARSAVGGLVQLLPGARPSLFIRTLRALGEIGCADQRVRGALADLWTSAAQTRDSLAQLASALAKLGVDAPGLVPYLTNSLIGSPDSSLRKLAAESLAWRQKEETDVVPALLKAAVSDKDDDVRRIAEEGLTELKLTHEKALAICAKQLHNAAHAEAALRTSGALAVPALISALDSSLPAVREKAARTLGHLGEVAVASAPALTSVLRDKDQTVRLAAAKALWNVTKIPDRVVPVLIDLLEDKNYRNGDLTEERRMVLQTIMEALGRIGPPAKDAVKALNVKKKDKNRHISESATSALNKISPPAVVVKSSW